MPSSPRPCWRARRTWPTSRCRCTSRSPTSTADTGRVPELMAQLQVVAALCQEEGDLDGAISACAEHARLAEEAGRVDESLRSLEALRFLLEKEGREDEAADCERHRAEMLRDAKLDLPAAEAALERAFALSEQLDTARMGMELPCARDDSAAEARWLERALPLLPGTSETAVSLLRLAKLHLDVLGDSARAEGFLREALRQDRSLKEAETLLCELLEREGRVAELAAFYEDSASHEEDAQRRVQQLLRAAYPLPRARRTPGGRRPRDARRSLGAAG